MRENNLNHKPSLSLRDISPKGGDLKQEGCLNALEIKNNLKIFLTCLKSLNILEHFDLTPDGENFCVATRSESASENWAFYDAPPAGKSDNVDNAVREAKAFFNKYNLDFIWPVLSGNYDYYTEIFNKHGLNLAGNLLGMSFDVFKMPRRSEPAADNLKFCAVSDDKEAEEWARTSWRGFGGDAAPEKFLNLSREMSGNKNLKLFTANFNNINAGTFLLCDDGANLGVYYFAVPPEFRRKKIAHGMMTEIVNIAKSRGRKKIVLQATPAGVPFYKNFGFDEIFNIPVFTNAADFNEVF